MVKPWVENPSHYEQIGSQNKFSKQKISLMNDVLNDKLVNQ